MPNTFTNLTDTIISQKALEAFCATMLPVTVFSHNLSADAARRGDKIKVLWTDAQSAAQAFVKATGYEIQRDLTAEGLELSLDGHDYVSWGLTDTDLSTQPLLNIENFGRQKGFQLAKKVLQNILGVITVANGYSVAKESSAANFDKDDVVDLGIICDVADWSEMGRNLVLKSTFHGNLRKDNNLSDASQYGSASVIQKGQLQGVDSFENIWKSNIIPANGEALAGFASLPDAMLVASRYLAPQEGHKYFQAAALTDPNGTGLTIGFRDWYNEDMGERRKVLECVYGKRKGNVAALKIVKEV